MRSGAAAGHTGYYHSALHYDSDEHLLEAAIPFLLGGVEAGEPSLVTLNDHNAELIRAALPADTSVVFVAGGDTYARPATAIRNYRRMLAGYVADGAAQIRIVGEVPSAGYGPAWDSWARYESAINHAYDEFPLWSMCAYDTRLAPSEVLGDVARTHPRSVLPGGRRVSNGAYLNPEVFLSQRRPVPPDRLQTDEPRADLTDPSAAVARQAIRECAPAGLEPGTLDDFIVAVSETVTNAGRYGVAPTRLRVWTGADRMIAEVTDCGEGPHDPFAGLLPAGSAVAGGLGLWITHQICDHVALIHDHREFTVRLTAGPLDPAL